MLLGPRGGGSEQQKGRTTADARPFHRGFDGSFSAVHHSRGGLANSDAYGPSTSVAITGI
jgi:hypothetical protein